MSACLVTVSVRIYHPLYRHSEEMIRKLEVAGLGFYVRETQQKLGEKRYRIMGNFRYLAPKASVEIFVGFLISAFQYQFNAKKPHPPIAFACEIAVHAWEFIPLLIFALTALSSKNVNIFRYCIRYTVSYEYCCDYHHLLGKIPLRQLVYRVLELPPSMCPLIYDFGQLNTAECDYTSQIVKDHVRI